ncbi:MAG: cytochrome o ubiquinol oxidase subunit IV [Proteobacteria bacterium]|nr:cytochrome o ubiquinol oxidase subunit IV [Pseudomonadota bacterium]
MSDPHASAPAAHADDTHAQHGSVRGYLTGFGLAVILTVIPFWLVMDHVLTSVGWTMFIVLALAAVQIVVHIVYFLHLDTRSEGGWNMMSFIFSAVLVIIVLGASIWVMWTEDALMMPMSQPAQHTMPQE